MTFLRRGTSATALLAAALAVLGAGEARAVDDPGTPRSVATFAEVRSAVLEGIAGATRRIWIVTDYLTDGEIVSALYVAQYRKLDVQVLLGRAKSNFYMSRLSYLKNQNIPVYLRPEAFKPAQPSGILTDDRLMWVDGDLDFLARVRRFNLTTAATTDRDSFAKAFADAAGLKVPAVAAPIPLVGRGNANGVPPAYSGPRPDPQLSSGGGSPGGGTDAYYYNKTNAPRPDGVPAKLPKGLKWEKPTPRPQEKPKVAAPPELPESGATDSEASSVAPSLKSPSSPGSPSSPNPSSNSSTPSNVNGG